ncbi:hypothetical protein Sme01_01650 [Sphaerisporangium melleum]|uniref:Uncharacterized protein n=1 Tax=Sphaerisporangium melleum TaxID=321316 RepID=A0A917VK32_9ACTN|nr:hypothetical protein [Sphaerisporangium melleum]GGK88487.1 hypothetical protein GCM10007964_33980 [Sphaerisporangium melleum]GII67689.1 hypothetical protein Sme01_01650 [Sphaerisporangium melleum]
MDPLTLLGGTELARGRMSFYISLQLSSAIAPGLVLLTEGTVLVNQLRHEKTLEALAGATGVLGVMVAICALAGAFVLGYICRELSLKLLGRLERLKFVRRRYGTGAQNRLEEWFAPEDLTDCFEAHAHLRHRERSREPLREDHESSRTGEAASGEEASPPRNDDGATRRAEPASRSFHPTGGYHTGDLQYYRFVYSKLWLRAYAPLYSIDKTELEINVLAAILAPVLFSSLNLMVAFDFHWAAVVAAPTAVVLFCAILLDSLLRLRVAEKREAVENLVIDYLARRAAARPPYASTSPADPAGETE